MFRILSRLFKLDFKNVYIFPTHKIKVKPCDYENLISCVHHYAFYKESDENFEIRINLLCDLYNKYSFSDESLIEFERRLDLFCFFYFNNK